MAEQVNAGAGAEDVVGALHKAPQECAEALARLEAQCFPADEAASLETIQMRLRVAGDFFWMMQGGDGEIVGFVNGTCAQGAEIEHDSMTTHVAPPAGRSLVIHSVSVSPKMRRRGLGLFMLKAYVERVSSEQAGQLDRILLLCKPRLLQLYLSAGFAVLRQSPVVHGQEVWFELGIDLAARRRVLRRYCPLSVVDAFSTRRFGGNPAAVVLQEKHQRHAADERWMQQVATENNLAETAFLVPTETPGSYGLRWFTPACEIALCGHATLASMHFLLTSGCVSVGQKVSFQTQSGTLCAVGLCDEPNPNPNSNPKPNLTLTIIELDFPKTPPVEIDATTQREAQLAKLALLRQALPGLEAEDVLYMGLTQQEDLLVEVTGHRMAALGKADVALDLTALTRLGGRGLILTCVGGSGHAGAGWDARFDFISRFFAPGVGIPEDPVTGSAHCALAPYWQQRLALGEGERRMLGFQASKRGGEVGVLCCGDRVKLYGSCVTHSEGFLSDDVGACDV